jgi:hypothetical protein
LVEGFVHLSGDLQGRLHQGLCRGLYQAFPFPPDEILLDCHKAWLCSLGTKWLDPLSAEVRAKIDAIDDIAKLEKLVKNLTSKRLKIATWDQLFASLELPSTRRARLR